MKKILWALSLVLILTASGGVAHAMKSHEDPEAAKQVFSGISLLRYYTDSLNFILRLDPDEVQFRLEKIPFSGVPENMKDASDNFSASAIKLAYLIKGIDENIEEVNALAGRALISEAAALIVKTQDMVLTALTLLDDVEQAAFETGATLRVASALPDTELYLSYEALMEKIVEIRAMLTDSEFLLQAIEESLMKSKQLTPTQVTLAAETTTAFVGDSIGFEVRLTAQGNPVQGRKVDILIDNALYLTVETDPGGRYRGSLSVPYRYMPSIDIQALYYPRDTDIGVYLGSKSPAVSLDVMFYEAVLEIAAADTVYPGLPSAINGKFDYQNAPPLLNRTVEIYLDDVLIDTVIAGDTIAASILLDTGIETGAHNLTFSTPASGRYAPVVGGVVLNVERAVPILEMAIPSLAFVPGRFHFSGSVHSDFGPLDGAMISLSLGGATTEIQTAADGSFEGVFSSELGLGIIGLQPFITQIAPKEPWHAPTRLARDMVVVNWLNTGGILIVIIILAFNLPHRLRGDLRDLRQREPALPAAASPPPVAVPVSNTDLNAPEPAPKDGDVPHEPRLAIIHFYRLMARFLLSLSNVFIKPQQTLREFAYSIREPKGMAGNYLLELTLMVEKLLYSAYQPNTADADRSRELSLEVIRNDKAPQTGSTALRAGDTSMGGLTGKEAEQGITAARPHANLRLPDK